MEMSNSARLQQIKFKGHIYFKNNYINNVFPAIEIIYYNAIFTRQPCLICFLW